MMKDSDLGKDIWGEALLTHIYLHNQCPSSTLTDNITPYEWVFGHAPFIGHLHIFGSKCYIKVPDESRSKLDDKAKECRLIGFEGNSIYVVVDSAHKKLWSCNIIFMEDQSNRNDKAEHPIDFPSQPTEVNEDKNTLTEDQTELPRWQTRSEVWGTDPTRKSKRINDKILI